jgi:hypothetical protein
MPLVHYHQDRQASTWMAAMPRRTRAAAANPAGGTSPASRQSIRPAAQRSAPAGISTRAVVSASAWEAWAANWFTPDRVDTVEGRTADVAEKWLRDHPGSEVVCRDGSGAYGKARELHQTGEV